MDCSRSIVVISTLLLLAGCNSEPQWKELKLPADRVSVQMPAQWTEQKQPDGQRIYQAIHGRTEYLLGVGSVPHRNLSADETRSALRQVRDAMVQELPEGKLLSEADVELEGRPGIEFKARGSNTENAEVRLFLTDDSLVMLVVDYKNSPPSQANIDKFFTSLTFNMNAASATPPVPAANGSAPTPAGGDNRNAWRYTNAPQIFPDQHGYNGVIRKTTGNNWVDETEKGPLEFIEDTRTPEYVELKRPVGDFRVRLYNDHSEYKFGYSPKWEQMFPGKWE